MRSLENRGRLHLVDLSRTPSGTFFVKVRPISEMASKNGQIVAFVAFRDKQCSRPTCHRAAQGLLRLVAGLVARF